MSNVAIPRPSTTIASSTTPNVEVTHAVPEASFLSVIPFTPTDDPTPDPDLPDPVPVELTPTLAGFRGGTNLIFGGQQFLNTTRDSSDLSTWAGDNPINAGPTAGPSTLVSPESDYLFGEFIIEFQRQLPLDVSTDSELLRFSLQGASIVVSGLGTVFGDAPGANSQTAPLPDDDWVQLRLVRSPTRLYGFLGDTQVLDGPAVTAATGAVELSSDALSSGTRIRTAVRNFQVRAHASVNGVLVNDKAQPIARQLTGTAPAAVNGIAELGPTSVEVFGLFGWGQPPLTYVVQDPFLVATEVSRTLTYYGDPAVFN